jgi:thioredoxin 1
MTMNEKYTSNEPTRAEVDKYEGATVIEFGTSWCGYCQAAQPFIIAVFKDYPQIRHLKIEDGKGRPLGRSFRVTLWPTLVFLKNGKEIARLVRPDDEGAIRLALTQI